MSRWPLPTVSFRNERGDTIISILVAAAIVAGALLAGLTSFHNIVAVNRHSVTPPDICREAAHNVLNAIRSNGVQAQEFRTPIGSKSVLLSDASWHAGLPKEVGSISQLGGPRWPKLKVINWSGGNSKFPAQTPLLIQSSINGLLSVYNSFPAACTDPKGIEIKPGGPLEDLLATTSVDRHDLHLWLKLRTYDLNTGALQPCGGTPVLIRPYGMQEPPEAVQANLITLDGFRADLGIEAEVSVDTLLEKAANEQTFTCAMTERFQYDRKETPRGPLMAHKGATLTVSIPKAQYSSGLFVVCRESHVFVLNAPPFRTPTETSPWLPCDRIDRICGLPEAPVVDESVPSVRFNLPNAPGCVSNIDAMTVDVAGNFSGANSTATYNGVVTTVGGGPPSHSTADSGGYQVGAVQFKTLAAAQTAQKISGLPINSIANVTNPKDGAIGAAAANLNTAVNAANKAAAQAKAAGASGSAAGAESAAATARAAANSAAAAYNKLVASNPIASLGAIGKAALSQAQAAKVAAEKAAAAAERTARAKRAAENAKKSGKK